MTKPQPTRNPFTVLTCILRMIKFSHTLFALPFAVMAAFLAAHGGRGGFCGWDKLLLILLCMVFARSVAMTFNRIIDANIDARNPRTQNREIPTGLISKKQAWIFLITCAAGFIATTSLFYKPLGPVFGFGNPWPLLLAVPILMQHPRSRACTVAVNRVSQRASGERHHYGSGSFIHRDQHHGA